jgi:hypothetical protein
VASICCTSGLSARSRSGWGQLWSLSTPPISIHSLVAEALVIPKLSSLWPRFATVEPGDLQNAIEGVLISFVNAEVSRCSSG